MENPATWGKAEKVVAQAQEKWQRDRENRVIGLSEVRSITDALRREGLLREESNDG